MIDQTIFPNFSAYSLRFDVNHNQLNLKYNILNPLNLEEEERKHINQQNAIKFFKNLLIKYGIEHYLGTYEYGKLTGKPHWQCIVWFKEVKQKKYLDKVRNHIKSAMKGKKNDGSVAFAPVKKSVKNLAAYCAKEHSPTGEIHSLTEEQYKKIPLWESTEERTKKKSLLLENELKNIKYEGDIYEWFAQFNKLYNKIYERPCLIRSQYYKWAYKIGVINDRTLCEFLGVFDAIRRDEERQYHKNLNNY